MLQIASGRLFTHGIAYRNQLRGVIFTNLRIHRDKPIEIAAGRILPLEVAKSPNAFAFEFTELVEGQADGRAGALVSRGASAYVSELAVIAAFFLNATCSPDANLVERLTNGQRGLGTIDAPSAYLPRVFDREIWLREEETAAFSNFVGELLMLERRAYRAAVRAMSSYVTGLHRMSDDLALAYTLLVASLESLAQAFDGHQATWPDYDEARRRTIDSALKDAPADVAHRVRAAVLQNEHVTLKRRFRDFTLEHLTRDFFRAGVAGVRDPIGRRDLPRALAEAYQIRSSYLHTLAELPRLLTLSAFDSDTVALERKPNLTFRGLTRVAREAILEFVRRQPKRGTEPYDYSLETPGVVYLPMAAQYWVGDAAGLNKSHGRRRLEGGLGQLAGILQQAPNASWTDLREMLAKARTWFAGMKAADRRPFLALYFIFSGYVPESHRLPDIDDLNATYAKDFKNPNPEALILNLLFDQTPDWTLDEHAKAIVAYQTQRHQKNGCRFPQIFEAGLSLQLAERYRAAGKPDDAQKVITAAVEDHPGLAALWVLEGEFSPDEPIDWRSVLLPRQETAESDG